MSGFDSGGASVTKKTLRKWIPAHFSARADIDENLNTLRNRAADLSMNTAVGAAAIQTFVTGVIGSGLKLFPKPHHEELGLTPKQARRWSRHVKHEFELWSNGLDCDFLRRNNFFELQRIAFESSLVDGDIFCLFKRRTGTTYSLRLHLIDAQRVSNPGGANVETVIPNSGNRIINGIEVDSDGRLLAIHVSNRIFNEPSTSIAKLEWQRVEVFGKNTGCRNVLHICRDTRPDNFRGTPLLAPVIEAIKNLNRFSEAELTAAVIKSYFSLFFTQADSQHDFDGILNQPSDPTEPCVDVTEYKLGVATMAALPKGVDVKAIDSSNSQSTFESFTAAFLTQIGAALNVPYELLVKKFQSSYSASRAALLQAQDTFRERKAAFVADFCAPIYEQFLTEAVALGRIDAPGFFDDELIKSYWTAADWYSERSGILDPLKDAQATQLRLALGLSTRERETAELCGSDFWDNVDALNEETLALSENQKNADSVGSEK